jgi:dynein heavy chain
VQVRYRVLNPKCINMGELYGEFNPLTQEWHDGLASSVMREFAAEDSEVEPVHATTLLALGALRETVQEKRWTVFDGPIDALWIENMNTGNATHRVSTAAQRAETTVLDDNMTLCLANGQRIKLKVWLLVHSFALLTVAQPEMKCLFEVMDLAVASPATGKPATHTHVGLTHAHSVSNRSRVYDSK